MTAGGLTSVVIVIILLLAAAVVMVLLARLGRGDIDLARLASFVAILTLVGSGIFAVASCWSLLFSPAVSVSVPIDNPPARFPKGTIDPTTVATVVAGGADRAFLTISGLTLPTRLLLLSSTLASSVMIGAVALVGLRAARALRDGDIFAFAPRAIMTTAVIVIVGGFAWTVLGDIGAWKAGVEALQVTSFGAEGALAEAMDDPSYDPVFFLAERGWLAPAHLSVTFPLWPLSIGLGLALVATAFRAGQSLRKNVTELKADVDGLI